MPATDVNADGPPIAARQASKLAVEAAGKTVTADVPATGDWDKRQTVALGTIAFGKPGEYEVVVRAADPAKWNAVNLWRLELAPAK